MYIKSNLTKDVVSQGVVSHDYGNSVDKFRHTKSVAYSVELVLLNKHQISGGGAYLHCYHDYKLTVLY